MILNYIGPYIYIYILRKDDMRSFLIVPNIKTHSVEGRAFLVEIGYA